MIDHRKIEEKITDYHSQIKKELINNNYPPDLANIIADYVYPNLQKLNTLEIQEVKDIALTFEKNHNHFLYKQFKKNFSRVCSPFSNADFNMISNSVLMTMTAGTLHLASTIPCFIIAIGQMKNKESKDFTWFCSVA